MSIYSNLYIKFPKQKGLPVRNSPFLNSHIISLVFHRWILTNSLSAMKCHKNICTTTILLISQIQYGLRIRYPLHPQYIYHYVIKQIICPIRILM